MFLGILFLLPIGVFAKGTMFIANGEVLNQCTGNNCAYPYAGTTNIRFILDPMSFNADSQYTFKLNFSAGTSMASPTLTDCGLNINGAYVSPSSRNSGRVNYECSSDYSNCTSTYASTIVWTAISTLSNVPVFIQCDMTPSATRYNQTNFAIAVTDSNGSVINAINDNTDRMIEVNNYNANENNKNRDANSDKIGGKIDNNTNVIGGKLDTHANTISGKLQQIIDNLTNLGSNIISGISSTIQSVGNGIKEKIEDLIGLNEVCQLYYSTSSTEVLQGDSNYQNGLLQSDGSISSSSSAYAISPYLPIVAPDELHFYNNMSSGSTLYACFYASNKALTDCRVINPGSDTTFTFNANSGRRFVRYTFRTTNNQVSSVRGQCHSSGIKGIFEGLFNPSTNNANTGFQDFINDFSNSEDYGGLQRVITSPLNMVNNMNSACSPINFTFPHTNNSFQLPCIQTYLSGFINPAFITLIKLVVNGFICYRCVSQLLLFFHDLKDPHNDEIEVLDL